MRISNPRSFAGDKALATRDFVTSTSGILTDNITKLSGIINSVDEKFEEKFTHYAYLNDDTGKIDPSVIPPISIIKTIPITVQEIIDEIGANTLPTVPENQNTDYSDIMNNWFGKVKDNYQAGDLFIVQKTSDDELSGKFYLNQLLGPWIVSLSDYNDTDKEYDEGKELIKLMFPTSDILSINGKSPDETGNVKVGLEEVLNQTNFKVDAKHLTEVIYHLDIVDGRFGIHTDTGDPKPFEGYATYNELMYVSGYVSGYVSANDEEINKIKADIAGHTTTLSKINGDLGTISGNLDAVEKCAVGIVKYDNVGFTEIPATGQIDGDSGIKYDLDADENLYKSVIENLNKGTQVLALTENGIPIYPDLFFVDKDDEHVDLNIVLVSVGVPSGTYTLYVLDTVNNIVDSAKANV